MTNALARIGCALLVASSCAPAQERPRDVEPRASAVAVPSTTGASGAGSVPDAGSRDAGPADAALAEAEECSEVAWGAQVAALRAALDRDDRQAALAALDHALEIHPKDVELWMRRGALLRQRGDLAEAALSGQVILDLQQGKSAFGWLLVGLGAEAERQPEKARAAFARAALLEPNGEASRKLGSASTCTANVGSAVAEHHFVKGWMGVFEVVNARRSADDGTAVPKTEAQAKRRVCIDSFMDQVTARDVCKGPGPWRVQTGGMNLRTQMLHIEPLAGNRFALIAYEGGTECAGSRDIVRTRLSGEILEVQEEVLDALSLDPKFRGCDPSFCPVAHSRRTTYYDTRMQKALLSLEEPDQTERRALTKRKLTRAGPAGCQQTHDLQ